MAVEPYTLVTYDGLDIGGIYLGDIGMRMQLGGGIQYEMGQDIYINKGESICLVTTGDVLLSQLGGTTGSPTADRWARTRAASSRRHRPMAADRSNAITMPTATASPCSSGPP